MPQRTERAARPTLSSVAAAAGVSLGTVSKVVNGRDDVAATTRSRVMALLEQHQYVPRAPRRSASDRSRPVVDLVLRGLDSPWAVEIIRGASAEIDVVVSAAPEAETPRGWAEQLVTSGRSGLLLVTSAFTAEQKAIFEAARLPCVVIDPVDLPDPDVPSVGATNWAGGLTATRHLLGLGHRRIAVIGGPPSLLCSRARIDGYRAAHETAGLPVDPDLVRDGSFHDVDGFRQGASLLALPERPTAIFAGSDEQAFGVIEAARQAGLRVPDDLSVVGFDDISIAKWASPPLTTVRQPLAEMGRSASRMLLTLIRGGELATTHVELATELVVRESTRAPA